MQALEQLQREVQEAELRFDPVRVGGVITELSRRITKRGDPMANFVLEDLNSSIPVFVSPRVIESCDALLENDAIVVGKFRVTMRDDQVELSLMELSAPTLASESLASFDLDVPDELPISTAEGIKRLLSEHPGNSPVFLHTGGKVFKLPSDFCVDGTNGLASELRLFLGPRPSSG